MRLHTHLTEDDIRASLKTMQMSGDIANDVELTWLTPMPSRSHPRSFEVRLGTYNNDNTNPYRENGKRFAARMNSSSGTVYAAAYEEWGWFLAELFHNDPDMKTSNYKSLDDFNNLTNNKFA